MIIGGPSAVAGRVTLRCFSMFELEDIDPLEVGWC